MMVANGIVCCVDVDLFIPTLRGRGRGTRASSTNAGQSYTEEIGEDNHEKHKECKSTEGTEVLRSISCVYM